MNPLKLAPDASHFIHQSYGALVHEQKGQWGFLEHDKLDGQIGTLRKALLDADRPEAVARLCGLLQLTAPYHTNDLQDGRARRHGQDAATAHSSNRPAELAHHLRHLTHHETYARNSRNEDYALQAAVTQSRDVLEAQRDMVVEVLNNPQLVLDGPTYMQFLAAREHDNTAAPNR